MYDSTMKYMLPESIVVSLYRCVNMLSGSLICNHFRYIHKPVGPEYVVVVKELSYLRFFHVSNIAASGSNLESDSYL